MDGESEIDSIALEAMVLTRAPRRAGGGDSRDEDDDQNVRSDTQACPLATERRRK